LGTARWLSWLSLLFDIVGGGALLDKRFWRDVRAASFAGGLGHWWYGMIVWCILVFIGNLLLEVLMGTLRSLDGQRSS
jgi:hypothetical protein